MNINKYMRFQVHDEVGLLRAFVYEDEAKTFVRGRDDLKLVVVPRKREKAVDLFKLLGESPF
jgi:riboflavin synthase